MPLQDVDTPGMGNFVTKNDLDAFKAEMLEAIKSMSASVQNNQNYHRKKPNGGNQYNERS